MRPAKKRSSRVEMVFSGYWYWILSLRPYDYKITGKYLFFSIDRERLIEIAKQEILHHQFHKAKVNSELLGKNVEYVLCLYYKDDSRKHELADRCRDEYPDVNYRYWKSDERTLGGEYSPEFLSKLDAESRLAFTAPKQIIEFKDPKGKTILKQALVERRTKTKRAGKRS